MVHGISTLVKNGVMAMIEAIRDAIKDAITEAIIDISYNGSKEFAKDKCMFLLCSLVYEHLSNSLKYIPFLSFVQLCSNTQHTEHKNYKTIMNEHSGCCSMPRVGCSILSVVGSATQGYFEYVSI